MGARKKNSVEQVIELSIPERILAVEKIWDSIADHPESVPVTKAQAAELDRRLQDISMKDKGLSWSQVKKRIRTKSKK